MLKLTLRKAVLCLGLALVALTSADLSAADRKVDASGEKRSTASQRTAPAPVTKTQIETRTTQPPETAPATGAGATDLSSDQKPATNATPSVTPVSTAAPTAGEKVNWMVFSGGGGSVSSAGHKLNLTVGQTAAGKMASASTTANLGFWQNFTPASCCTGTTGNVNMTGIVDLGDLSALVSYLTGGGYVPPCNPEANVNNTGIVDLGDLSVLVSYLTGGGYVLPNCM